MQANEPAPVQGATGPEEAVIAAMMTVGQLMKTRLADGIEPGTHHLLHTLRNAGPVRVTDLAQLCRLDTSTVSRHVASLERNGLVSRSPHPDDGRAMAVALSAAGLQTLEQAISARKELLIGLLADWPREDVETFARLLTVFAAGADAMRTELDPESATKPSVTTPAPLTASAPHSTSAAEPELEHV